MLLSVKSESPVDGGSLVTKIGQLYIVDVLCAGLMRKNGDRYRDNVDRANKSVTKNLSDSALSFADRSKMVGL